MANVEKTKLGKVPCRSKGCDENVYLFQHVRTGTLSAPCQECDCGWHAPKGSKAARDALAALPQQAPAPAPVPEPKPAPAADPAPDPKPAPTKTRKPFSLDFS